MIHIFYAVIRAAIKKRSMLPSNTFQYIEALELIAKKAMLFLTVIGSNDEKAKEKVAQTCMKHSKL